MVTIISNDPRGNPTATVKRLTGTPDNFIFTTNSKPQQQKSQTQWYKTILFSKYRLQVQIRIIKNSESASTSQVVEERYKNKSEARVFARFLSTRAFPTVYKYRD
ncbi:hypothetical protein [Nostoc sp. TCL240-02]|uniref:hypothetical protein n=1 Tax=Nostoc sp. TCL240-02 TaxID=2572090 RepID=UPI00157F98DF|nr:hypothetical protein [Nostoc sp. TCL240-02]QKQ73488.1 hypothetical protein FBB35_09190 [Nostoc sp. TCL240-02]